MTTFQTFDQGTFSWADLAVKDLAKAKDFYGKLFGWTFDDQSAGANMTYSMGKIGGKEVAALYTGSKDAPVVWQGYVTVKDVDAAAKKVPAAGGTVVCEPTDVMDAGRMAIIKDPTGGTIALWQGRRHAGARVKHEPGALTWVELMTHDPASAKKFYVDVIGWKTIDDDMGPMGTYTMFSTDGTKAGHTGGMMAMPPSMKNVPSHWVTYFSVTSCDASAKRVGELGGRVLKEPADIPKVGRFAICADPQGATFAVFEPHS